MKYTRDMLENDMLVKLNIHDISVKNVPIPARYADEKSKIRYSRFIVKTSFYFVKALIWRSWNKYVVKLNPIGAMYLSGSLLTVIGFFALFALDVLYILLGFSLFGVAAFSEILRNKFLDTKFSKEVEVTPLNE